MHHLLFETIRQQFIWKVISWRSQLFIVLFSFRMDHRHISCPFKYRHSISPLPQIVSRPWNIRFHGVSIHESLAGQQISHPGCPLPNMAGVVMNCADNRLRPVELGLRCNAQLTTDCHIPVSFHGRVIPNHRPLSHLCNLIEIGRIDDRTDCPATGSLDDISAKDFTDESQLQPAPIHRKTIFISLYNSSVGYYSVCFSSLACCCTASDNINSPRPISVTSESFIHFYFLSIFPSCVNDLN